MFIYSKNSNSKIVHHDGCGHAARIQKENRGSFATLEAARAAGYRLCKHCAPINRFLSGMRAEIATFCRQNGMSHAVEDGGVSVKTACSEWRIIVNGACKKHIFLYHKNTRPSVGKEFVPGYHSQAVRRNSILEYLNYIACHEDYRRRNPLPPAWAGKPALPRDAKCPRREQERLRYKQQNHAAKHALYLADQMSIRTALTCV